MSQLEKPFYEKHSPAACVAQQFIPRFHCWLFTGAPNAFNLIDEQIMQAASASNQAFAYSGIASMEVHVTAPATIRVHHSFGPVGGNSYSLYGYLAGHLINQ